MLDVGVIGKYGKRVEMKWCNNLRRNLEFKFFHVRFGKNLRIRGRIILGWKVHLTIGDDVIINSGVEGNPNPIGNEVLTTFATVYEGKIQIGNRVGISNSCLYARDCVVIEDDVMIGGGCKIFDTDFHPLNYWDRIQNNENRVQTAPIRICQGAFIGAGSIIMKGVTVGKHSIVGAGSVVTKSIPDNEVWAGNPAKKIYKLE